MKKICTFLNTPQLKLSLIYAVYENANYFLIAGEYNIECMLKSGKHNHVVQPERTRNTNVVNSFF